MKRIPCPTPECDAELEVAHEPLTVVFPDDLAETLRILTDSLHLGLCLTCDALYVAVESFTFWFPRNSFVAAWVAEGRVQVEEDTLRELFPQAREFVASEDRLKVQTAVFESLAAYATATRSHDGVEDAGVVIASLGVLSRLQSLELGESAVNDDDLEGETTLESTLCNLYARALLTSTRECIESRTDFVEVVEQAIPSEFLTLEVATLLANVAQAVSEKSDVEWLQADLALAWVALKLGITNVRSADWVACVAAWALQDRSLLESVVPSDFLKQTIHPEQMWDQVAARIEESRSDSTKLSAFAASHHLLDGVEPRVEVRIPAGMVDRVEAQLEEALSEQDEGTVVAALASLWRSGQDELAVRIAHWGADRFKKEHPEDSCRIIQALCSFMIRSGQFERALDEGRQLQDVVGARVDPSSPGFVALVNEVGNAYRYLGDHASALAEYQRIRAPLEGDQNRTYEWTVLQRNIAISLRGTGDVRSAYEMLVQLWTTDDLDSGERPGIALSLATTATMLGRHEEALAVAQQGLDGLSRLEKAQASTVSRLRLLAANLNGFLDDRDKQLELARLAGLQAPDEDVRMMARVLEVEAERALGRTDIDKENGVLASLDLAIQESIQRGGLEATPVLVAQMASLLERQGQHERVVDLVHRHSRFSTEALFAIGARAALSIGDPSQALELARRAWSLVARFFERQDFAADDITTFRDREVLQGTTADIIWHLYQKGLASEVDLVWASELQSSPVAYFQDDENRANWAAFVRRPEEVIAALEVLAGPARIAVLHFLETSEGVVPVIMSSEGDSAVGNCVDEVLFTEATGELQFLMNACPPNGRVSLERAGAWLQIRREIGTLIGRVAHFDHLVIIRCRASGDLPIHLIDTEDGRRLGSVWPCSYAMSLVILASIRRKREMAEASAPWRPASVGILATGKANENETTRQTIVDEAKDFALQMHRAGLTVREYLEEEATIRSFHKVASAVDLLVLSCHGVILPSFGSGLLLSHDGAAPPGLVNYVTAGEGRRHVLSWQEVVPPTPPLVISWSCSSGLSSYIQGGERLGLDRAFLSSGTRCYVAPLWDVTARSIGEQMRTIVAEYLSHGEITMAEAIRQNLAASEDDPTAAAIALFGDWI